MAAFTTAAIGLATAGAQIWSAASEKKSAKNALRKLSRPEDVIGEEDVSINTRGFDYATEANARGLATGVNELRASGIRGLSALPKLIGEYNDRSEEIAIGLTNLDLNRQYKIADRKNRLNDLDREEYRENVIGLNNRIQTANQNMWSGIMGAGSAFSSMAGAAQGNGWFQGNGNSGVNTTSSTNYSRGGGGYGDY